MVREPPLFHFLAIQPLGVAVESADLDMSEDQLKAFLEKVKGDTSLQEKLKATANSDAVIAIAEEAGFGISADDFNKAHAEVSEEELEGAAGGGHSGSPCQSVYTQCPAGC